MRWQLGLSLLLFVGAEQPSSDTAWTRKFFVEPGELGPTGRNPWLILEPGHQLVLEHADERLVITVTSQTRRVAGIETRVVEERETKRGALIEVSRNFYAISRRSNSVFYFGEEVDIYENGRIAGHEGAWIAGQNGARFGLMMPGIALLNARYYQELAPGRAMDRARIVSVSERLTTPAGTFTDVLKIEETTPLEVGATEYKYFAAGIGLVQDGLLKLAHRTPTFTDSQNR